MHLLDALEGRGKRPAAVAPVDGPVEDRPEVTVQGT